MTGDVLVPEGLDELAHGVLVAHPFATELPSTSKRRDGVGRRIRPHFQNAAVYARHAVILNRHHEKADVAREISRL